MNIGLIAHDGKKKLMQNFCIAYRGILNKHELFATATTGRLIEEVTNLTIHKYLAGPLGGEQQMASQIEHNLIDMVIFLRDPQNQQLHEPDIFNVMHLCDVHNIPLATNLATAELLVKALERGDLEWREMYRQYRQRERVTMKKRIICTISIFVLVAALCSGCSGNPFKITDSFASYYAENKEEAGSDLEGMAADLAVVSDSEATDPNYQSNDYADLLINDSANEIVESYHCFDKLYPASITKVMTALLTLEHGNMDDEITLKHDINLTEDGAVISTLTKGDTVTVSQVFHTMLIKSANDCAVILAEYVAGSEAKFIDMMNERARELGATHTHFVNPNGLHNNDHYTTAYDLYLIFKEAVKHEEFVDTVSSKDYTMTYTTAKKTQINEYMQSTNYYLLNEFPVPEGVVMYGGKTGTTSMAKSCLILMTKNKKGERFFSVVLGAETKEALYSSMTRLLEKTTN